MQGTLLNSYWVWLVVTCEIRVCVAVHSVIDTERASLTCCFVGSMSEDGYEMGNIVFMALCIAILVMLILTSLSCLCMCQKHYNAEPDGGRHVPHVSIHVSYRVSCCCCMWTRGGWGLLARTCLHGPGIEVYWLLVFTRLILSCHYRFSYFSGR